MVRPGRRTGRLPDLGIDPPRKPTPAEQCPEGSAHNEEDEILVGTRHRVFLQRQWWRGKLIGFVMVQRSLVGGSWVEIIRADTCHEQVHLHIFSGRGEESRREVIAPIEDFASVQQGYDACNDRIFDHLEANVRQWESV